MATSITSKAVQAQESSRDTSRQFTLMDPTIDIESDSSFETEQSAEDIRQMEAERRVEALKKCLGGWRMAGGVLGIMMVLGWVCIIAVLILEEKWQLVLIAWLLLYAAAHFCYWYFKRHSLISIDSQIRDRFVRMGNGEKSNDQPPTYDEILKSEAPPPAYYAVVEESPKGLDKLRNALMSTGAIPKVFKIARPSKTSANLQHEESQGKSSGSLADRSNNSLYIIEEHFSDNESPSLNFAHPHSSTREGLHIPDMVRTPIVLSEAAQPPSYDSIVFENSHLPSRKLSKVAVDIEEQE